MRLEIHGAETGSFPAVAPVARRRRRPDPVEWGLLALFLVLSMWIVGLDLYQALEHGYVWTHTDGIFIVDQMQYLGWIVSASHHGLISNMFVLRATPADYLEPAALLSAGLVRLGVSPWLSLLLWKPVAVVATFFAFRMFVHDGVRGTVARRAALILALFYGMVTVLYGSWGTIGDAMPLFLSWGYTWGLLAGALLVFAVVLYGRTRERRRAAVVPGLLGGLAALLHPWQGELLILLIAGSEAVLWIATGRRRPRHLPRHLLRTPLVTVVLTGLPLLYYEILQRTDLSWELGRLASKHSFPVLPVVIAMVPIAIPALCAWRPRQMTFPEVVTRVWLVAVVIIWALSATAVSATPLHAIQGITVPLAVLAVQGVQRLRAHRLPAARVWLVLSLALATIPGTVALGVRSAQSAAPTVGNGNFIHRDDQRALDYLARDPTPGGVITPGYLGAVVPGLTRRATFMGDCMWSEPDCPGRTNATFNLDGAYLSGPVARELVSASGARFVLTDCQAGKDLTSTLGPILVSAHHFGCASVYEVRPPAPVSPALAQSRLDAALRAAGR